MDKTSFVAMICPYADKGRSEEPVSYKVLTWLPFVLGQKLENLGRWELDSFPLWKKLFVDRFQDMSAKNLSTYAIDQDEPLVYIHEGKTLKGVNVNILDSMSKWLKFQNELDHGAGETWENVGELVRTGQRDVMINFNTNTPERYRDFDLSVAYHYEGFGLVLEIPPPFPRWQNVLQPFSKEVWISMVISLMITIVFYHKLNAQNESSPVVNAVCISQSLLSIPMTTVPGSWRIRNFLLIWWIASWILKLSWICNLIAVLTIPVFPTKIQTKQELAESKYRLCMLDYGEFVPDALKTSEESTLSSLGRKLDLVPLMIEWSEFGHEGCVNKVIAGTHAQAETYSYINILYSRLKHSSRVYMLKDQLYPSYLSFRFRKHTPWKYKFDIGMQRLYESGLIQLWVQRAMEDFVDNTFQDRSLSEQEALTLNHLQGTFFILAIGIILATLTVGGEVLSPPKKFL
ncbi:glutamate receptor ionotropic, delta-1-like [Palaemon carinicauda]|uniref:glutamate receptor ionotropic, delta-1-like n=1 Tax=Palaemon carinicauda TaxID=392227 RepID=UPI0035B65E0A